MEIGVVLLLLLAMGVLLLVLGLGVGIGLLLFKLGVIGHHALRKEPPDEGSYSIEQSREIDER